MLHELAYWIPLCPHENNYWRPAYISVIYCMIAVPLNQPLFCPQALNRTADAAAGVPRVNKVEGVVDHMVLLNLCDALFRKGDFPAAETLGRALVGISHKKVMLFHVLDGGNTFIVCVEGILAFSTTVLNSRPTWRSYSATHQQPFHISRRVTHRQPCDDTSTAV